jgi:hypothetical protein
VEAAWHVYAITGPEMKMEPVSLDGEEKVVLKNSSGKYEIVGSVGGVSVPLLMDTGSAASFLTKKAFDAIQTNRINQGFPMFEVSRAAHAFSLGDGKTPILTEGKVTLPVQVAGKVDKEIAGVTRTEIVSIYNDVTFYIGSTASNLIGLTAVGIREKEGMRVADDVLRESETTKTVKVFTSLLHTLTDPTTKGSTFAVGLGPEMSFTGPEPIGGDGSESKIEFVAEDVVSAVEDGDAFELNEMLLPSERVSTKGYLTAAEILKLEEVKAAPKTLQTVLANMLAEFPDLTGPMPMKSKLPVFKNVLLPGDHKVIRRGGYTSKYTAEILETLDRLHKEGIIEEITGNMDPQQWLLPIVPVVKRRNGKIKVRITIDLSLVNAISVKLKQKLPLLAEFTGRFAGCTVFSGFDNRDWFFQFPLDEESMLLFGFKAPDGRVYRMVRAAMGVSGMPGFSQQFLMDEIVEKLNGQDNCFIHGYLDDITLGTKPYPGESLESTRKRHLAFVRKFLELLREWDIRLSSNFAKCQFAQSEIKALGVIFDGFNVRIDPERISGLMDMRVPAGSALGLDWLRSVIGMFSYFRSHCHTVEFIKNLDILEDLKTRATRSSKAFIGAGTLPTCNVSKEWDMENGVKTGVHTKAFETLKKIIAEAGVHKYLDPNKKVYIYTDASDVGWAYVLTQYGDDGKEYVVGMKASAFKQSLSQHHLKVSGKEAFAVVSMVRDLGLRLVAWDWVLRTDHRNLMYMQTTKDALLRRWYLELRSVCTAIQHIPGSLNVLADVLSRQPVQVDHGPTLALGAGNGSTYLEQKGNSRTHEVYAITEVTDVEDEDDTPVEGGAGAEERAAAATAVRLSEDSLLLQLVELQKKQPDLIQGHKNFQSLSLGDGSGSVVVLGTRLVVPDNAKEFKLKALRLAHDAGGHGGQREVAIRLSRLYFWKNLYRDVEAYVSTCSICQMVNAPLKSVNVGTMTSRLVKEPRAIWIADFMGKMPEDPSAKEFWGVLTFTDAATRLLIAVPVVEATSRVALEKLKQHIIMPFGRPKEIWIDNGTHFKGEFEEGCNELGIKLHTSHAHHHQSIGKGEVQHRELRKKLRNDLVGFTDKKWVSKVADATRHINESTNSSTGETPLMLMHGEKSRNALDIATGLDDEGPMPQEQLEAIREVAAIRSSVAALKAKKRYDGMRDPPPKFSKGDGVLLYMEGREDKLDSMYRGPFYIERMVENRDGNFYVIGEKLVDKNELQNLQEVSVQRLVRFDPSRTTPAELEAWRLGSNYQVVKEIIGHYRDKESKVLEFTVKWDDGTVGVADIRDLRYNVGFDEYCTKHGIRKSWVTNQVALEYKKEKGKFVIGDEVISPPGSSDESVDKVLKTRARKVKPVSPGKKGEVADDGVGSEEAPKFKKGDLVEIGDHRAEIVSDPIGRGGHWYYLAKFPGYKVSSAPYEERFIQPASDSRRRRAPTRFDA